ncbi:MAG: hypothetical protein HY059_11680 [Proteobacteria bacterium]|nr:hypothetical protein [Pseudomonadota bacterium]
MSKNRPDRISRLEAKAAERLRQRLPTAADTGPPPSTIITLRLAEIGPSLPMTPETFDEGTALMRRQVAEASGARRNVMACLLRLRVAHAPR